MKYLVKDLAKMTGLSPSVIRKWQERFKILNPDVGENGYYYYDNDDLFILKNIAQKKKQGESISHIVKHGRDELLKIPVDSEFDEAEWKLINIISRNDFNELRSCLEANLTERSLSSQVRETFLPLVVLVGRAWEKGVLSVADEHSFSRWFTGYFSQKIVDPVESEDSNWLVSVYPQDEHELGALMHYGILREDGVPARFCGKLPEKEIITELSRKGYRRLSVSVVGSFKKEDLDSYKSRILNRFPNIEIIFGGRGVRTESGDEDFSRTGE